MKRFIQYRIEILTLLFFIGICKSTTVQAQEQFHSNQFIYSAHAINPAFAGIEDLVNLNVGFRKQWAAIQEAPASYYLGFNGSLSGMKNTFSDRKTLRTSVPRLYSKIRNEKGTINHGLGFYLSGESFGPFRRNSLFLGYAFIYTLSDQLKISAGISSEITNQRFKADDLSVYNPDQDAVYQQYASGAGNDTYLNFNPGVVLYGDRFFIGYSVQQLLSVQLSSDNSTDPDPPDIYQFLVAGYNVPLGPELIFQPSALVKYNSRYPVVADVLLKLKYRGLLWGGLSYRYDDAFGFQMGFHMTKKLYLSYSYEAYTSDIGPYSKGTHEMVLGFRVFDDKVSKPLLW